MSPQDFPRHTPGIPESYSSTNNRNQEISLRRPELNSASILEARSLQVGWRQKRDTTILVRDIDFKVFSGSLVALIGPNGAGKSTLLKTIAGLQAPCGGSVTLLGKNIASLGIEERASFLSCIFNEKIETGYLTVREFVAFGRYPYTNSRNKLTPDDVRHIAEALEMVGMIEFAARTFSSLSDGERQKIQIARAIAQNTPLLIFDEPTAFLDAPSRIEIFKLAERLVQKERKTIILCTHEIDLALKTADSLWVIDRTHRFVAGSPFVIAHSGAIGRAFDLPTVIFDSVSGTFRARSSGI
jgi:iron complex transport system ATP-binding protein